MTFLFSTETWLSLLALSTLEVVLGLDNLVFITLATERLSPAKRRLAWRFGLGLACGARLAVLGMVDWLSEWTQALFHLGGHAVSGYDLILIGGGLFLLVKGGIELYRSKPSWVGAHRTVKPRATLFAIILQIVLLDIVFSLDSVMTAVALVDSFLVMAAAILLAVGLMMGASTPLSRLVQKHPRLNVLGISFLVLVGAVLTLDGVGWHISRGYLYTAIGFALWVETMHAWLARP